MSIAIKASTAERRRHSPASASGNTRVRSPRTVTTSCGRVSARRTSSPGRERIPEDGGTTISTGSVGPSLRPDSQAALAPAKTASGVRTRRQAESFSHGSSGSLAQQYSPWLIRRQVLPLNLCRVSPAARASSSEKGLVLNSDGMRGALPTRAGWRSSMHVATQPVNRLTTARSGFGSAGMPR